MADALAAEPGWLTLLSVIEPPRGEDIFPDN